MPQSLVLSAHGKDLPLTSRERHMHIGKYFLSALLLSGGGKTNPGLLEIQFKVSDKPGLYRPTVQLIGGNSYRFTIEAAGR